MAQPQPFEIPQQLRELAEKNVETARAAYGQFMDAVAQAMGVWTKRHAGECGDLQLPGGAGSRHQVCQTER